MAIVIFSRVTPDEIIIKPTVVTFKVPTEALYNILYFLVQLQMPHFYSKPWLILFLSHAWLSNSGNPQCKIFSLFILKVLPFYNPNVKQTFITKEVMVLKQKKSYFFRNVIKFIPTYLLCRPSMWKELNLFWRSCIPSFGPRFQLLVLTNQTTLGTKMVSC